MAEMAQTIEELRTAAASINAAADWLYQHFSGENDSKQQKSKCAAKKVEKENINTGSMESELFLAILSSMAEGESVSISENSKWSIQKRFENGTFKCSYPPYGYDWDGEQMVINLEQAVWQKKSSQLCSPAKAPTQ